VTVSALDQLIDVGTIDPALMNRQGVWSMLGATVGRAAGLGVMKKDSYKQWRADGSFLRPGSQQLYASGSLAHGTWGSIYRQFGINLGTRWVDPIIGNASSFSIDGAIK